MSEPTDAWRPAAYRVQGVLPGQVVAPDTRESAAECIRRAGEQDWAVVPFGGGTCIEFGFPPARMELVLTTERLNRVVDYQPDDMTVTVDAGLTLAALQRLLAERGQFLPLDPAGGERCTLGGIVATGAAGPWRAGFGTPRDWLIGCRVLNHEGAEVRGGGQVVKNVAGYDLPKLYTGSFGTLGLLVELTFKVLPRPSQVGFVHLALPDLDTLEPLLTAVLDSDVQPAALELAHRTVLEDAATEAEWSLLVQFLHVGAAVAWQQEHLLGLAGAVGCVGSRRQTETAEASLRTIRDFPGTGAFCARLSCTGSDLARLVGATASLCLQTGTPPRITAHAATGQVWVTAESATAAALATELRAASRSLGASCVFPRLPAELWGVVDPWGEPGAEGRLLRGLKQALDPPSRFSPGRFVGRL